MAATLTRHDADLAFAPGDGALVLRGSVAPDGTLGASLNTQPAGKPPYALTLSGRIAGDAAVVTYATPRCAWRGTLARHAPSALPWQ